MSAWADQVESEEATNGTLANISDFPALGDAVKMQPKAKGKKPVKLGLGEFLAGGSSGGSKAGFTDKSLQDKEILASLPTASRGVPREEGDGRGGIGGGFRDYGGDREGRGSRFQRDDRPPREEREPSRADTVDDWGATRTFVPGGNGGGFGGSRGFGGGFADRGDRGDRPPREPRAPSAADAVDDWGSSRKYEPSGPSGPRGGFEDRRGPERRFDGPPPVSKADTEDSWGRGRDYKPSETSTQSRGFSGSRDAQRDNTADREERWARRTTEPSTSSAQDAPAERPRLKLAPRSVPAEASSSGAADDRKSGANPFGAARPREEVLKEKGVDPIKEALKLEHGEVIRDETPAEKELKAEVEALQKQLAELKASSPEPAEGESDEAAKVEAEQPQQLAELEQQLDAKERALLKLQAEEDDRVRFARGSGKEGGAASGGGASRGGARREEGKEGAAQQPRKERW